MSDEDCATASPMADGMGGDWQPRLIALAAVYRMAWLLERKAADDHFSVDEDTTLTALYDAEAAREKAERMLLRHIRRTSVPEPEPTE